MIWTTVRVNRYQWHKWFAWRPVVIEATNTTKKWVLFDKIYRRRQDSWGSS